MAQELVSDSFSAIFHRNFDFWELFSPSGPKNRWSPRGKVDDFATLKCMSRPMRRGKLLKLSRNDVLESTSGPESFRRNCQGDGVLRNFFYLRSLKLRLSFLTSSKSILQVFGIFEKFMKFSPVFDHFKKMYRYECSWSLHRLKSKKSIVVVV